MTKKDIARYVGTLQQLAGLQSLNANDPPSSVEVSEQRLAARPTPGPEPSANKARQNTASLEQIEQAKQEREATADALSEIVCVLDDRGRFIRANQTVERWDLAPVADVKGRELHNLLHPLCTDPACCLRRFWHRARNQLDQGHSTECEAEDRVLGQHLRIQVWPIQAPTNREKKTANAAVVVVYDVTEHERTAAGLKRSRELVTLNTLTATVSRSLELPEVLTTLAQLVREQLDIPGGGVFFCDTVADSLALQTAWFLPQAMLESEMRVGALVGYPDPVIYLSRDYSKPRRIGVPG